MSRLLFCAVAAVCAVSATAYSAVGPETPAAAPVIVDGLPEGEGRETTRLYCTQCHAIGLVTSQRHTREEWEDVILRMGDQGFYASAEETETILSYLSEHFNRE